MPYPNLKDFVELLEQADSSLQNNLPFVLYRKPFEDQVIGIFQEDARLSYVQDFSERGFVFAPFDFQDNAVWIQPDEVISSSFELTEKMESEPKSTSDNGREAHVDLVKHGISEINKGVLKKVVLSRQMKVNAAKNPTSSFVSLLQHYPKAFCYLFHHPQVGTWCGATPETLVQIKNSELKTMSLAATVPFREDESPEWSPKEVDEQAMVSQHIKRKLSGKMETLQIGKAESIRAGNLWHLRSEITGKIATRTQFSEVVKALHPTSAVCGIPTAEAKEFILKNENYNRSYYTGFLGELNLWNKQEVSLFVNLRCMELKDGKACIYVGGGITKDSKPQSEWIETQNKSRTMLNIL